ncbi:hypothetical protein QP968_06120 [Corynebacterium sp. MSK041]|uniref:hypothetical protein n=1 Tax=Corynebacterium sp. MSK041 TaxID=3050194 RepID=UPI00254AF030|nr:hypothetical protein [Corynebacterium sp. MSK041]MDK8795285.1 hypothetical protein [Corynebacterium sp. MSK041]
MTNLFNGMSIARPIYLEPLGSRPGLVPISDTFGLAPERLIDSNLAERDAEFHHQRLCYQIPQAYRAAAFALENPHLTLTAFGALALYGAKFLGDGCDTVFAEKKAPRSQKAGPRKPHISRAALDIHEKWSVCLHGTWISIASPAVSVAHALAELRREKVGWPVVHCGDLHPTLIRAVQLIDVSRRLTIDPLHILAACKNRLDLPWVTDALIRSSSLAESPKETEMRLIAAQVARKHGLHLREQVPVQANGRWITRFDLALICPVTGQRFGLMYDGIQHWDYEQRNKDANINLNATIEGWVPLRFSSASLPTMFEDLDRFFTRVLNH